MNKKFTKIFFTFLFVMCSLSCFTMKRGLCGYYLINGNGETMTPGKNVYCRKDGQVYGQRVDSYTQDSSTGYVTITSTNEHQAIIRLNDVDVYGLVYFTAEDIGRLAYTDGTGSGKKHYSFPVKVNSIIQSYIDGGGKKNIVKVKLDVYCSEYKSTSMGESDLKFSDYIFLIIPDNNKYATPPPVTPPPVTPPPVTPPPSTTQVYNAEFATVYDASGSVVTNTNKLKPNTTYYIDVKLKIQNPPESDVPWRFINEHDASSERKGTYGFGTGLYEITIPKMPFTTPASGKGRLILQFGKS